jgi:hypothetical protein
LLPPAFAPLAQALGERGQQDTASTTMAARKVLDELRCSPSRTTAIGQAILALHRVETPIDANTRLVIALGDPQPGNRNDTIVYRAGAIDRRLAGREVMAAGGYRGNLEVIILCRKPRDGSELPAWKQDYNTGHRKIRARVEHARAHIRGHRVRHRPSARHRSGRLTPPTGLPGNARTELPDIT